MSTLRVLVFVSAMGLYLSGVEQAAAAAPYFTQNPTAVKTGNVTRISFAVSQTTDVTVIIEDANGKPVRHLVSGMLGTNPPPPLVAHLLSQYVEWDGKADWGAAAPAGPFTVRVSLGLGAQFDKTIMEDTQAYDAVMGIAVAPDGTVLLTAHVGANVAKHMSRRLIAINRDGTYQRTLFPPPSTVTSNQISALGGVPIAVGSQTIPMVIMHGERRNTAFWSEDGMVVMPGNILAYCHPEGHLGLVDLCATNTAPLDMLGPPLMTNDVQASFFTGGNYRSCVAYSTNGYLYFSGLATGLYYYAPWPAVYRVPATTNRSPVTVFFGDPSVTGNDQTHLGDGAHGLALDGQGHLLICDSPNCRVLVVNENDGSYAGEIPTSPRPEQVVAGTQGTFYVLCATNIVKAEGMNTGYLSKRAAWPGTNILATINLPGASGYNWDSEMFWWLAVDTNTTTNVLWASNGTDLLRLTDRGNTFSAATYVGTGRATYGDGGFLGLSVDHFRLGDPEVYIRSDHAYSGSQGANFLRYNEASDTTNIIAFANLMSSTSGANLVPGVDSNLYVQAWPYYIFKWDRNGNPLQWTAPFLKPDYETNDVGAGFPAPPGNNAIYVPNQEVFTEHTMGMRQDNHLFSFSETVPPRKGHKYWYKALYEYLTTGDRASTNPVVWRGMDSLVGTRFDQQNNIYVAELVKPWGEHVPPEFTTYVGPFNMNSLWHTCGYHWYPVTNNCNQPQGDIVSIYGSIVKFSPQGGSFGGISPLSALSATYDSSANTPTSPVFPAMTYYGGLAGSGGATYYTNSVTGALWVRSGISEINAFFDCDCESTRFDVDPYGRVWHPDLGRYRVSVLDTMGNSITTFGGYGNTESRGTNSPVIDSVTGKVRPRQAGDPVSVFATPDIAMAFPMGVGATDKYAYIADSVNRRLTRVKLVYAAEATLPVITPPTNTITITATADPGGAISPSGTVSVLVGSNQTFNITPAGNYRLDTVLVDSSPVGAVTNYTFSAVTTNHTVEAVFALVTAPPAITSVLSATGAVAVAFNYQITALNSPAGYGASGLPDGLLLDPASGLISGTPTTVGLSGVSITASNYLGSDAQTLALTILPAPTFVLTVNTAGNGSGTVALSPTGGLYTVGTVVTLTATPAESTLFTGWSGDFSGTNNPATLLINGPKSVTAAFPLKTFTVFAPSTTANGSMTPSGEVTINYGTLQTFTITPNAWYAISSVLVDGISVGAPASYTFTNITANHTIVTIFSAYLAPKGTPFWWLAQYGYTNNFAAAELADLDGDGVLNGQEYLDGTDPADPLSRVAWNRVPYAESFENLAGWGGQYGSVLGYKGWSSSVPLGDRSRIASMLYVFSATNYPLPGATHTNVLLLDNNGTVLSNSFGSGFDMSDAVTYFDAMVQFGPADGLPPICTPTDTGTKGGVVITSNNYLAVYHGVADLDGTLLSNQVDATSVYLTPANWYRLTLVADATATNPANALAMFQVKLNGLPITSAAAYDDTWKVVFNTTGQLPAPGAGGTWFRMATTNSLAKQLTALVFTGTGYIDDLVVCTVDPFAPPTPGSFTLILVQGGSGSSSLGGASPYTAVSVAANATTQIVYIAADWYRISALASNGAPVSAASGVQAFTQMLANIIADISNNVAFALATPDQTGFTNVPTAWLTNWTQNAVYAGGVDGFSVSAKYLLGLDPTVSNSYALAVDSLHVSSNNVVVKLKRTVSGALSPDGMHGYLTLQATPKLGVAFTDLVGTTVTGATVFDGTGHKTYTNAVDASNRFFKAVVE